jgi:anion-transporting  ArsA/GET3 family ATPase
LKMRQNRVLQPLRNTNNKIQENGNEFTNPQRKSPRLLATPKHLNLSNTVEIKNSTKQVEIEPTMTTPKLETENQAVNKTLAKQKLEITAAMRSNATANSGGQLVTGDLASLCTIM